MVGAPRSLAASAAAIHPTLDVALARTRHRESPFRHARRDRGAGSDVAVRLDLERCDEIHVAADERARADLRAVLGLAVVVHDDGAAAEARALADVGIADVREVVGFHARAEHAVLHLDEVADARAGADVAVRAQVRAGPDLDVVADPARLDRAVGLQVHARSDAGRALDHTAGLDQGVLPDLDVRIDIRGRRVDDGDTRVQPAVGDALAHQ